MESDMLWFSDKTGGRTTQTTGDRWTLSYYQKKEVIQKEAQALLSLQSVCQISRKKQEAVFPQRASSENLFRLDEPSLGYGRICPHNRYLNTKLTATSQKKQITQTKPLLFPYVYIYFPVSTHYICMYAFFIIVVLPA